MEFDWEYYLNRYPELKKNGIVTRRQAYHHWVSKGKKEQRYPNKSYEEKMSIEKTDHNDILDEILLYIKQINNRVLKIEEKIDLFEQHKTEVDNVFIEKKNFNDEEKIISSDDYNNSESPINNINKMIKYSNNENSISSNQTYSDSESNSESNSESSVNNEINLKDSKLQESEDISSNQKVNTDDLENDQIDVKLNIDDKVLVETKTYEESPNKKKKKKKNKISTK